MHHGDADVFRILLARDSSEMTRVSLNLRFAILINFGSGIASLNPLLVPAVINASAQPYASDIFVNSSLPKIHVRARHLWVQNGGQCIITLQFEADNGVDEQHPKSLKHSYDAQNAVTLAS